MPAVWAHRGRSRAAPENTLAAFLGAVESGDAGLELDTALSADGVPVVIHDDTVDRTTDGSGSIAGMTAGEIARLDAGSWFDAAFAGTRIPTLEEVFEAVGGRIAINVELKSSGGRERREDSIESKAAALAGEFGIRDSVLFSSFDWGLLESCRALEPHGHIGVLMAPGWDWGEALEFAGAVRAYSIHPYLDDFLGGGDGAAGNRGGNREGGWAGNRGGAGRVSGCFPIRLGMRSGAGRRWMRGPMGTLGICLFE